MTTDATTLQASIRGFAGELLTPGAAGFDEARRVQNDAIDRRPALIARCAGPHDVAAALRHARREALPVTVRGGGHGPDRFAVDDGALVIDLTAMRGVEVDPVRRCARVQGGATWREVDAATQRHGLAVTGARLPSVGVAGFTLGSGSGWLERKLGLAADSLRSVTVVTADGELVRASGEEREDLFWAMRGGGPSFGVVVELEFALHPVGTITAGVLGWEMERAAEVGAAYAALMAVAGDDLGGGLALLNAPPAAFVPERFRGTPIAMIVVLWTGAPAAAPAAIAPLRALAPVIDAVGRMPYAALQGMFESPEPYTARIHGSGGFLSGLAPDVLALLAEHHRHKPADAGEHPDPAARRGVLARARGRDPAGAARRAVGVAGGRRVVRPGSGRHGAGLGVRLGRSADALVARRGLPELHPRARRRTAARILRSGNLGAPAVDPRCVGSRRRVRRGPRDPAAPPRRSLEHTMRP